MSAIAESAQESRPHILLDAIETLETVAFLTPKQRQTEVGQLAKVIASDAYQDGIPLSALGRLMKILTSKNQLDQNTSSTLIKNLYPSENIPSHLVTNVVCCLGPSKNKPSTTTQFLLLRWLIMVYECLDDPSHLSKLYSVLFNMLDMISLRKPLCHLLALITRRKHVKPFRIQALMELLQNSGGDDKELLGLLRVFKNHYPDIIIGDLGISTRSGQIFRHPDPEWSSHVKSLQDRQAERLTASTVATFQIVHRGAVKRAKAAVLVPDVQTSRVSPGRVSLEELRSVDDFVNKLEKIDLPNQLVSSLANNLVQKYLLLVQPDLGNRRLQDWLEAFLSDVFEQIREGHNEDSEMLGLILSLTVEYARHLKEIPPAVLSFLKKYLLIWNGKDHIDQIFGVLEYVPMEPYESLRSNFLDPLEAAFLSGDSSRTVLLDLYIVLLRHWTVELRTRASSLEESKSLSHIISHAELMASSVIEAEYTASGGSLEMSRPATFAALEFHTSLVALYSQAHSDPRIRLTVPLAPTFYTLVFTPGLSTLSILSSILAAYRSSLEASLASRKLQASDASEPLYQTHMIGQFNGYIMDICNLIWRNRAFNTEDPNAHGCLIPSSTMTALTQYIRDLNEAQRERRREDRYVYTPSSIFSLSHHIALCNISAACFAEIEGTKQTESDRQRIRKPVTQKILTALEKDTGIQLTWQEYRLQMLDWLDGLGSLGIGKLMRSTMKALQREG